VTTILHGSLFPNREIEVPSGRLDLRPPKIIIGISLTLVGESTLAQRVITLPAILDTGFNRVLEIDEWHLNHWAGLHREHLVPIEKDKSYEGRKYDLCGARIWLHRTPYTGPRAPRDFPPLLLKNSPQVRVMSPIGKPNPRLPLLGLSALIQNRLRASIDGENTRFRIHRSLRLSLSDWYRERFRAREDDR
jgi:hypothetical protein